MFALQFLVPVHHSRGVSAQEFEVAPHPSTAKNKERVLTCFPTSGQVDFSTNTVEDAPCPHAENLGLVWTTWGPR